jgi:hypothetical protein
VLAGTATFALTTFAAEVPAAAAAFVGVMAIQQRMAQLVPVFIVLLGVSAGVLGVARKRKVRLPKLTWSRKTWWLHLLRSAFGVLGTLGIAASAFALKQQGISVGYATMFGALAGVITPVIRIVVSLFGADRPRLRRVVLSLSPAGIAGVSTAVGFGFDPSVLSNPWIWVLAATACILAVIPFIQKELSRRERDEYLIEWDPFESWADRLVTAKINLWVGVLVALVFGLTAWSMGPVGLRPDGDAWTATAVAVVLYPVYAFSWQQANAIGDTSLNGIVYVLGVLLGFIEAPFLTGVHVTPTQIGLQIGASLGITLAVVAQTRIERS